MDKRNDDKSYQSSNKKPDPEIHDRFNHGTYASNSLTCIQSLTQKHGPARRMRPVSLLRLAYRKRGVAEKAFARVFAGKLVNVAAVRTDSTSPAA
jgi:hypothetical protein